MESLPAVRAEIVQLKDEAARAKKDDDKVLYRALQQRLAAMQAKEVLLMGQGVLTRADSDWACERRRKISLWDQKEC